MPAEITARCTNGIKEALVELAPQFERVQGVKLNAIFGSTKLIIDAIDAGAKADLLVLTDEAIEQLIARGKIKAGSRTDIVRSGIGVAVRKGAPKPAIDTADALKRALLAAKTVSYSRVGASGIYMANVLIPRLGIVEEMKSRTLMPDPGTPVGVLLAEGKAEIGLQQISELMPVPGIEIVGPLPDDLQKMTTFSAGICADTIHADAVKALVAFLTAAAARPVMRKHGLEPL